MTARGVRALGVSLIGALFTILFCHDPKVDSPTGSKDGGTLRFAGRSILPGTVPRYDMPLRRIAPRS